MTTPWEKYQSDLNSDNFTYDDAQCAAVKELQRLYDELVNRQTDAKRSLGRWLPWTKPPANKIKGIYFWGGVGRGKTYLVDTFFDCLPFEKKMRVHFHRFMHRVHQELSSLDKQSDPLKVVAQRFADETQIICFDEFFVSDITDAMILGTLMEALFAHGIVLVATSNIEPHNLYKNGLQRARFLPAIKLIEENTRIVNVDSGVDYRLRTLTKAEIYHYPLDQQAENNLAEYFYQLARDSGVKETVIEINNRQLPALYEGDSVVMFSFDALCNTPRSQSDYMEISRCYNTVLLSGVRCMDSRHDDIARRFIAMVDEFYERNVKLIISAETAAEFLYRDGRLEFEFRRCLSRLVEMQSVSYLKAAHLP